MGVLEPGLVRLRIRDYAARLVTQETLEEWLGEPIQVWDPSALWLVGASLPGSTWDEFLDLTPDPNSSPLAVDGAFYVYNANTAQLLRRGPLPHGPRDFASIVTLESATLAIATLTPGVPIFVSPVPHSDLDYIEAPTPTPSTGYP